MKTYLFPNRSLGFALAKELILYGSDEVYKAYLLWTETGRDGNVSIKQFGKVVAAIRKDMNPKSSVTYEEVLRLFINDFEDAKGKGLLEGIPLTAIEPSKTNGKP